MWKKKGILGKAFTCLIIFTLGMIVNHSKVEAAMDNGSVYFISETSASLSGRFDTQYPGTYLTIRVTGAFADGSTEKYVGQRFYSSGQEWNASVEGLKKGTTYTVSVTEYEYGTTARTPIVRKFVTPEITHGPSIKLKWSNVGLTGPYSFQLLRSNSTGNDILYSGTGTTYTDTNPFNKKGNNFYHVMIGTGKDQSIMYSMVGVAGTAPGAVTNFKGTATGNAVQLTWNSVSDADSYTIKRNNQVIGTIGSYATGFVDKNLNYTTNYNYSIYPTNQIGDGPATSTSVTTEIAKPPANPTIRLNGGTLTNQNIYAYINASLDSTNIQYKLEGDTAWKPYNGSILLTNNTTIYAQTSNSGGYQSEVVSLVVNNIDKTAPTSPTVSIVGNKLTIIPGSDPSGISSTKYQIDNGSWLNYEKVITLENGEHVIRAKSIDNAGNESDVVTVNRSISSDYLYNATKAVEEAEAHPVQSNVDVAQELVGALSDSTDKTALQDRLKQVQSSIHQYNSIQTEISTMNTTVHKGNMTKEKIAAYKQRVDELYVLTNALPNTMDKTSLNKQLDELKNKLILIGTILELNNQGSYENIDFGKLEDEIRKLPESDLKHELEKQLDQAKGVQDAIKKVEQAEQTKSQADVDRARDAVDKLPDGKLKDDLLKRIDEVQDSIHAGNDLAKQIAEATKKVETAEGSKTQTDVNVAKDAVSKLPEGQVKKQLNDRLDAVQAQIDKELADLIADATKKVVLAEQSKTQLDVNTAREKVNQLPTGQVKTDLNARLDRVQSQIDGQNQNPVDQAVKKAEETNSQIDVDAARDLVNTLPTGSEKDDFHKRLDAVDAALKAAISKVGQAENYQRDPYVTDAQNAVEALKESPAKKALQDRLDTVKKAISDKAYKDQLDKAVQKVEQAELYKREPYIKNAYDAVNALPDGADKTGLLNRLDQVGKETPNPGDEKDGQFNPGDNAVDVAKTIKDSEAKRVYVEWAEAVDRAEKFFSKGNIVFALNKMNAIPTVIGDNSKYNALYAEI